MGYLPATLSVCCYIDLLHYLSATLFVCYMDLLHYLSATLSVCLFLCAIALTPLSRISLLPAALSTATTYQRTYLNFSWRAVMPVATQLLRN